MSAFDDHFSQVGASALASYFGETITYTPPTGSSSTADICLRYAIPSDEKRERRYTDDGVRFVSTRTFTLIVDPKHEQFCGVESPQARGKITINSVPYVIDVLTDAGSHGCKKLMCERHQAAAVTREEYYRRPQ